MKRIIIDLLRRLNLSGELEDFDEIHRAIEKDVVFRGTNLWILVFAIIVASVGLNTNSTAVIIGAMLISPLMGPINGMGYSIATYDFDLLRKSLKNFTFAVFAGLAASTFYFALSPVSTEHSELLARTSPTIYDVMIALFGGLAGIVAITSKQKGNVIPGVAIATALMPPLCTAGYGLATGKFPFFFGALYLFTINTVFIAFSALVVSQMLKFPIRTLVNEAQKKKINQYLYAIIAITILPSIYFGYLLVQEEKFTENATKFTNNVSVFEGSYLIDKKINSRKKDIKLIYGGSQLTDFHKKQIIERTNDFSISNAKVSIEQGFAFNENIGNETEGLKSQLNRLNSALKFAEQKQDSLLNLPKQGLEILQEIKPLFPEINSCSYSTTEVYVDSLENPIKTKIIIFGHQEESLSDEKKANIENWLKAKFKTNDIIAIFKSV
jgi:uncharacterized hydrophobic protein (TIGR00271 family)